MKHLLLVVNVILAIAVAVLFYFHFSSCSGKTTSKAATTASSAGLKIAYFEMDSLENQYNYWKEVHASLRQKEESNTRILTQLNNSFNKKVQDYQQHAQLMTQVEREATEKELGVLQNQFQTRQQELSQSMQSESMRQYREVKTRIQKVLADYSQVNGISLVYASNEGDNIFYKQATFDITADLLKKLNEEYQTGKKDKK